MGGVEQPQTHHRPGGYEPGAAARMHYLGRALCLAQVSTNGRLEVPEAGADVLIASDQLLEARDLAGPLVAPPPRAAPEQHVGLAHRPLYGPARLGRIGDEPLHTLFGFLIVTLTVLDPLERGLSDPHVAGPVTELRLVHCGELPVQLHGFEDVRLGWIAGG